MKTSIEEAGKIAKSATAEVRNRDKVITEPDRNFSKANGPTFGGKNRTNVVPDKAPNSGSR